MTVTVKPVPAGYNTVSPFIVTEKAPEVLAFLKATFGAEVMGITYGPELPEGRRLIMNAEVRVGTSMVMIAEARDGSPAQPASLYCYVNNVDATHAAAIAAKGDEIMPPMDMFYGDRHGGIKDPGGNTWYIASHIEDMSGEELQARADAFHAGG